MIMEVTLMMKMIEMDLVCRPVRTDIEMLIMIEVMIGPGSIRLILE